MLTLKSIIFALPILTEDKVAENDKDPSVKHPEYKALRDTDIVTLAKGSVIGLAASTHSKYLLTEEEYKFIISGGNEAKMFIHALLEIIAQRIQHDPGVLETFITKVLDEIGPPVSDLGERFVSPFSLIQCVFIPAAPPCKSIGSQALSLSQLDVACLMHGC